jgi:uncharacterized protein YmfQ (DUF2313 family)
MAVRNASDYYAQLVALLPPGPAWDVERVPAIRDLLTSAAEELAREDLRLSDLFNEMFPDTVRELVPDWERVMDLPDHAWVKTRLSRIVSWRCAVAWLRSEGKAGRSLSTWL